MNPDAKISAQNVERYFASDTDHPIHALGPLDLDIDSGAFVCLVGPSGCGKSTFLRICAGLVRPSAGVVEIRTEGRSPSPIAMVFQDYSIYPWKTVEGNVRFGLQINGVSKVEARDRARHWLDRLGLGDFADSYPDALSGGMRQRVSIARAMAVEPEILLMDEPFAALDAQLRQLLQEELLRIWQDDKRTVLFVTHSLEEALVLGDRVIVMTARPGRLLTSFDVPFGRPRSPELRGTSEFNDTKAELWSHLKQEVEHHLDQLREASKAKRSQP